MDVCLFWLLFVVKYTSLRRDDHSSRGVLPNVLCRLCVINKNLVIEEAIARISLQLQQKKCIRLTFGPISTSFIQVLSSVRLFDFPYI